MKNVENMSKMLFVYTDVFVFICCNWNHVYKNLMKKIDRLTDWLTLCCTLHYGKQTIFLVLLTVKPNILATIYEAILSEYGIKIAIFFYCYIT